MVLKPCKKSYSRNPATRRCKKRCKRVPSGGCQVLVPCKEGQARSRVTKRCRSIATSRRNKTSKKSSKKASNKARSKKSSSSKQARSKKTSTKSPSRRPSTKSSAKSSAKPTARPSPQSGTQCHICLAQMKNTERRRRLGCDQQHVFHDVCIKQWLRTKSTCPVCRGQAAPSSVVRPSAKSSKKSSSKPTALQSATSAAKSTAKGRTWNDMIGLWKQGKHTPKIKSGVFWETSSVSSGGNSVYRETQVRTSRLPMTLPANPAPFSSHLQGKSSPVSFRNLGKDAVLVSPPNKGLNFSHIGTFYSNASRQDIKSFWRKVAIEVEKFARAGTKVYVSTSGTNVHWLHVRIEKRPKYYTSSLKNT